MIVNNTSWKDHILMIVAKAIGYWALLEGAAQELLAVFLCGVFTFH